MSKMHINNSTEESEFAVPSAVLVLEEDSRVDASLYKDTAEEIKNNNNSELVVCKEGDDDSNIDSILEDIGMRGSNDEIDSNHFVI